MQGELRKTLERKVRHAGYLKIRPPIKVKGGKVVALVWQEHSPNIKLEGSRTSKTTNSLSTEETRRLLTRVGTRPMSPAREKLEGWLKKMRRPKGGIQGKGLDELMWAASRGDKNGIVMNELLRRPGTIRRGYKDGTTLLHAAAWGGNAQLCLAMIAAGGKPKKENGFGMRPLDFAREKKRERVVAMLLEWESENKNGKRKAQKGIKSR